MEAEKKALREELSDSCLLYTSGLRTCRPSFKEVLVPAGCAVDRGIESGLEKPDVKVRKTGGLNAEKIFGRLFGRGGNGG